MTEEIKEILNGLSKKASIYKMQINEGTSFNTDEYEANVLLNYITNLQKEKEDYKQRNEKAVEWCECVVNAKYTADKLPNGKTTDMGYCLDLAEPLLNILKSGDE